MDAISWSNRSPKAPKATTAHLLCSVWPLTATPSAEVVVMSVRMAAVAPVTLAGPNAAAASTWPLPLSAAACTTSTSRSAFSKSVEFCEALCAIKQPRSR